MVLELDFTNFTKDMYRFEHADTYLLLKYIQAYEICIPM